MKKIFLFTCLEVLSTAAKKLYHVAVISFQITSFFFWKVVHKRQVVLYTISEPCLASKRRLEMFLK